MFSLPKAILKRRQNELDHSQNVLEGGLNFARQAYEYLAQHNDFPGLFARPKLGKDGFLFVFRKAVWIDPIVSSKIIKYLGLHL
jgi:hypothetical protein